MIIAGSSSPTFPKSARLLKPSDFRFRSFRRFETRCFKLLYGADGAGRLGISLSKKVLRRANARNRVRRLLKEAFRHCRGEFSKLDVHVIGLPALSGVWRDMEQRDIDAVFETLLQRARPSSSVSGGITRSMTGIERASSLGSE